MSVRRALLSKTTFTTFKQASPATCAQIRHIHPTSVALKKKKQTASSSQILLEDADDAFTFDGLPSENELFGSTAETSRPSTDAPRDPLPGAKTLELLRMRVEMFESLRVSTLELFGRPGKLRQPPRKSTIVRLVALSDTKEQLEKAVDVVAAWRNAALPVRPETCDEFIGRCVHLQYPALALKVLQDRPKYGVDVPSIASARHLLNALSRVRTEDDPARPLRDCLALAELYPLYDLPPASTDVISCVLLARVIARQVPKDRVNPQENGEGEATLVSDPLRDILEELKAAVAGWEGVDATRPKNMLPELGANVEALLGTVRRKEGAAPPWLKQLRKQIGYRSTDLGSLNAN